MIDRKMLHDRREALREDGKAQWATLIADDVIGIDGDIERLVGIYQAKYGYTRHKANAELVRRLSSLVQPEALVRPLAADARM